MFEQYRENTESLLHHAIVDLKAFVESAKKQNERVPNTLNSVIKYLEDLLEGR